MQTVTLIPKIFPFLSEDEKYAIFTPIGIFSKMNEILLLDENGSVLKELNSDDFVLSKGFKGTDNKIGDDRSYYLYYKTEVPITISYDINVYCAPSIEEPLELEVKDKEREERILNIKKKREEMKQRLEYYKNINKSNESKN